MRNYNQGMLEVHKEIINDLMMLLLVKYNIFFYLLHYQILVLYLNQGSTHLFHLF